MATKMSAQSQSAPPREAWEDEAERDALEILTAEMGWDRPIQERAARARATALRAEAIRR